jgi:ectoine hydroxylase-related dioxygenase (phytanoyl-CoA dioxygenase family)/polysaccharide pyruvyl transferase WcaK-like protein
VVADVGSSPHVGDEAMLLANLDRLRGFVPELRILLVADADERSCRRLGVDQTLQQPDSAGDARDAEPVLAALAASDGLLVSGGGNLSSSWPLLLRRRTALMRAGRRLGRPVVVTGQTLGPLLAAGERVELAEALGGAAFVGVRELPSLALGLSLGVPADRLCYQEDDAFLLAPAAPAEVPAWVEGPWIALSLDDSFTAGAAANLDRLAEDLARIADATGARLAFLPHVAAGGGGDLAAGEAAARALARHGVACELLPVPEPRAAAWLLRRAAAVISSRYHGLVLATAGGVPALGIYRDAYTRIKLQGALAHLDLAEWTLSASRAEEGGLWPLLRSLWERRREAREAMESRHGDIAARAEGRWQRIFAALGWQTALPEPLAAEAAGDGERAWLLTAALGALHREREASNEQSAQIVAWEAARPPEVPPPARRPVRRRTAPEEEAMLTESQWSDYLRDGYLHLGPVLSPDEVEALCARADELALGRRSFPELELQLDTGGDYEQLPGAVHTFERGTLLYRKVQGLQHDPLFARLLHQPVFADICARHYGAHAPVSIFRAMVMNKPAGQGTYLPWHQDGGDVWKLDRDPLVTTWVALDPATRANGCVEVVPGTHRLGLLTTHGSTLTPEDAERHCPADAVLPLEVEPGHALLLHNWLIHRSGINPSPVPRRAFSACYMDGRTVGTLTGQRYPMVFGEEPSGEHRFVEHLRGERRVLSESLRQAQEFAASLQEENANLRRMREEAQEFAASLQEENANLRGMREEAQVFAASLQDEVAQLRRMREEAERYALTLEAARDELAARVNGGQRWTGRLRGLARRLRAAAP